MLPTTFRFIWQSGFGVEDLLGIYQSATRIACAGHVCQRIQNEQSLQRAFHRCYLPRFGSFGQAVSEQKIFQESTNQQQELPVPTMFAKGSGLNEQSLQRACHICFLPSQVHLAKRFQRRRFFQESTNHSKKNMDLYSLLRIMNYNLVLM